MRGIITLLAIFWTSISSAAPIDCAVTDYRTVNVTLETPHPNHALIHRPAGETVWLQTSFYFVHQQIPNFRELKQWLITPETKGTVWVNGKATAQPIITTKGKYHLYIADNTETERENTYFVECYFVITE